MKLSAFPAPGLALILALGIAFCAGATPPPPPPPESKASYDAIDRLRFLEGDWEGVQSSGMDSSISFATARRVGRFGADQDHLLIGFVLGSSTERHPRVPLEGRDIITASIEILTFDPIRGGYWAYAPGFFGARSTIERGHDEQVDLELIGLTEAVWTQRLTTNRVRTIHVRGDNWDETLAYVRPDGTRDTILEQHLTRFPGAVRWGIVSPP